MLAAAAKHLGADLVLLGQQASDSDSYVMAAAVAEHLQRPLVTQVARLELAGDGVRAKRQTETGYDVVEAPLPAVISVSDAINEPRYASLKAIMGARKKPQTTLALADLGVEAGARGTEVLELTPPAAKEGGRRIEDENGSSAEEIVAFLRRAEGDLMGDILVFCEQHDGAVGASSLGLLEEAARLASALGAQVDAVVCGSGLDDAAMAALGGHGARTVYVARRRGARAVAAAADGRRARRRAGGEAARHRPARARACSPPTSAAALAARLGSGLIVDTIELHADGGRLVTRRPGLGDSVLAHCALDRRSRRDRRPRQHLRARARARAARRRSSACP